MNHFLLLGICLFFKVTGVSAQHWINAHKPDCDNFIYNINLFTNQDGSQVSVYRYIGTIEAEGFLKTSIGRNENYALLKRDSNGKVLKLSNLYFENQDSSSCYDIINDIHDNVWISGIIKGTNLLLDGKIILSGRGAFLIKLNADFKFASAKIIFAALQPGTKYYFEASLCSDSLGNVFGLGSFKGLNRDGEVAFSNSNQKILYNKKNFYKYFIFKFNCTSEQIDWLTEINTKDSIAIKTIDCSSTGAVYALGIADDSLEVSNKSFSSGPKDSYFLLSLDGFGKVINLKTIVSTYSDNDYISSISAPSQLKTLGENSLVLSGTAFRKIQLLNKNADTIKYGAYLLKIDTSGTYLWHKVLQSNFIYDFPKSNSLKVDQEKNVYTSFDVAGLHAGDNIYFDTLKYTFTNAFGYIRGVLKVNENGNALGMYTCQEDKEILRSNYDQPMICLDKKRKSRIYLAGIFINDSLRLKKLFLLHSGFKESLNAYVAVLDTEDIKPSDTTGLGYQLAERGNIKVFPNPANNELQIQSSENIKHISLYNIAGVQLWAQSFEAQKTLSIDTRQLACGIYFLLLQGTNTSLRKKIVVQH